MVTKTQFIREAVPANLVKDCPGVSVPWRKIEDIISENKQLRGALDKCTAEKRAIRKWNEVILQKNVADVN